MKSCSQMNAGGVHDKSDIHDRNNEKTSAEIENGRQREPEGK